MDEEFLSALLSSSSSSSSTESTSSSDDEEFFELQKILFARAQRHRVKNFVKNVVSQYSDFEFRQHFRVSRDTADKLTAKFANSEYFKKSMRGGRPEISAKVHCLAFLWFAGNKESYRKVANLFDMPISIIHRHLNNFLEFLYDISKNYIKFPKTEEEKQQKADEFAQIGGIPNTIGCIDGCYIYIRNPVHKIRSTYVNRHGLISITMQAICDANKKFMDVFLGAPSKIHDSRIFKLSFISKELPTLCGDQYHILGDAAYPIREYLMTPYRDYGDMPEQHKKYNKKHCQTRVFIENAFGLLKQRFRQLVRLDFFSVEKMCKFVLGCCVIHNFCIDELDLWDNLERPTSAYSSLPQFSSAGTSEGETVSDAVLKHLGVIKRNRIAETI